MQILLNRVYYKINTVEVQSITLLVIINNNNKLWVLERPLFQARFLYLLDSCAAHDSKERRVLPRQIQKDIKWFCCELWCTQKTTCFQGTSEDSLSLAQFSIFCNENLGKYCSNVALLYENWLNKLTLTLSPKKTLKTCPFVTELINECSTWNKGKFF